jgi:hypothetical protein
LRGRERRLGSVGSSLNAGLISDQESDETLPVEKIKCHRSSDFLPPRNNLREHPQGADDSCVGTSEEPSVICSLLNVPAIRRPETFLHLAESVPFRMTVTVTLTPQPCRMTVPHCHSHCHTQRLLLVGDRIIVSSQRPTPREISPPRRRKANLASTYVELL